MWSYMGVRSISRYTRDVEGMFSELPKILRTTRDLMVVLYASFSLKHDKGVGRMKCNLTNDTLTVSERFSSER